MDRRENVLYEALFKNDEETQKWSRYKTDNEDAIKNLENFRRKMNINIMVPIGSKALMPGKLVHTNEVLVSHFGKLFSNCTSYKAQEICKNRIKVANDYLGKLETEKDLFTNKLEMPHFYGAVPNLEQQEIIEEYNEEEEKLWREEHRKKLQEQKQKERETNSEEIDKTHEEVMKRLEDLEMLDELEAELQEFGIEDDDTLHKLMSGEIDVKEKKRISHCNNEHEIKMTQQTSNGPTAADDVQNSAIENLHLKYKTIKISDFERNADNTNNNCIPNDEDFNNSRSSIDSDEISDTSSDGETPEEFILIIKEAEEITAYKKRLNFIRKKIKLIEKEVDTMRVTNPNDLDVKLNKIETRDYLLDYVLTLEDESKIESLDENIILDNKDIDEIENEFKKTKKTDKIENEFKKTKKTDKIENEFKKTKKTTKKISFALKDDITYIDKNEKVENMLNGKRDTKFGKDKITLDPQFQVKKKVDIIQNGLNGSKKNIIEKVQENIEYMQEHQSHEDFDLVSKILNSSNNKNNTLQIKFKHSPNVCKYNKTKFKEDQIESPTDFYEMFGDLYPQNCDSKTSTTEIIMKDDKKPEVAKESKVKVELNKSKDLPIIETPPILKNKNAVKQEPHFSKNTGSNTNNKKKKKKQEEVIPRMTLGDVVENPNPEKPDPLPDVNFVDAHAPKKRISKFKQARSSTYSDTP